MCREDILEKICKLNKMADSAKKIGNEAEAAAFAQKVQMLLMQHKLDMSVLDVDTTDKIMIDQERFTWDIGHSNKRSRWLQTLAHYVAKYNGCRTAIAPGTNSVWLIGTQQSRQVCGYLMNVLARVGKDMMEKEYRQRYYQAKKIGMTHMLKGWRKSFAMAFVSTIGERMKMEHDRFMQEHVNERGLMVLDQEQVALDDFMQQYGAGKLGFTNSGYNEDGLHAGAAAGSQVDIRANALTTDGRRVQSLEHK